jgi:hypothetical protein
MLRVALESLDERVFLQRSRNIVQQSNEQDALAKSLGAFERRYRESCSLSRAWGYTLLFSIFIGVWGITLFTLSFDQLLKTWPLLLFSVVWFCLCVLVIASSWQSYFNAEWISLYNDGFIYHEKDQLQAYRWNEILSIEMRYTLALNGKNPSVFHTYHVQLTNGKTLDIVKGDPLKSQFERYQQQLLGVEQAADSSC